MKRLIIAGILFVSVIAIYITSLFYITNSCDEARNLLKASTTAYQKHSVAPKESEKLKNFWDKREKILSVFVNHERIDDIEEAISLLNVYAKSKNNELFYEYADTVKILLHQIMEDTKITVHSIF